MDPSAVLSVTDATSGVFHSGSTALVLQVVQAARAGSDTLSAEVQGHEAHANCARGPATAASWVATEARFISRPKSRTMRATKASRVGDLSSESVCT
jgi:hypothetical protein